MRAGARWIIDHRAYRDLGEMLASAFPGGSACSTLCSRPSRTAPRPQLKNTCEGPQLVESVDFIAPL
jgi:hypothetical protein